MKNLQNFGVQELNNFELENTNGGFFGFGKLKALKKLWKVVKKYGGKALDAAGVYDAINDFSEGFSEGNC